MDCILHDLYKQWTETRSGNLSDLWEFILQPATAKCFGKYLKLVSTLSFTGLYLWFQHGDFHDSIHFFTEVLGRTELYADGVCEPKIYSSLLIPSNLVLLLLANSCKTQGLCVLGKMSRFLVLQWVTFSTQNICEKYIEMSLPQNHYFEALT